MPRRVFCCASRARPRGGFLVFAEKQENTEEIKAMPFQKGQSGNPAGRPRGIVNRATALAQNLLSERAEGIARKVIELDAPQQAARLASGVITTTTWLPTAS